MNRCSDPFLVGGAGDGYYPTHPSDFAWGGRQPAIGCSSLWCPACRQPVRSTPEGERGRLYQCQCVAEHVTGVEEADRRHDLRFTARDGWTCAGHPPLALQTVLDGIGITEGIDFGALARRVLPGFAPPPIPPDGPGVRGFWLARLYHLVDSPAVRTEIGRAAATLLTDADPALRVGALFFFLHVPDAEGAGRVVDVARTHRHLYGDQSDPHMAGYTLDERLFQVLQATRDRGGLNLMREELLAGRNPVSTLFHVDHADGEWIVTHARELATRLPTDLGSLVHLVLGRTRAIPTLKVIAATPGVDPVRFRAAVEQWLGFNTTFAPALSAAVRRDILGDPTPPTPATHLPEGV